MLVSAVQQNEATHTSEYVHVLSPSSVSLCASTDRSQPGSSVHGILQARTLEWVATPSSRDPPPRIEPASPASTSRFFTTSATWKPQCSPGEPVKNMDLWATLQGQVFTVPGKSLRNVHFKAPWWSYSTAGCGDHPRKPTPSPHFLVTSPTLWFSQ